jgi:hypothetical protein
LISCWPNENDNVFLEKLNRRIEHVTGLWAATNKNFSEPYMVSEGSFLAYRLQNSLKLGV